MSVIQELLSLYNISSNTQFITSAADFIKAYVELGFSYLEHKELFDNILDIAGYSPMQRLGMQKQNAILPLNKSRLRSVIGKWTASPYNSHTIGEVINDVIYRVENNINGSAEYYTAKKDGSCTALLRLSICDNYALLHNVFPNKFYHLEKKESSTVKE